jgi:hypothetical protein
MRHFGRPSRFWLGVCLATALGLSLAMAAQLQTGPDPSVSRKLTSLLLDLSQSETRPKSVQDAVRGRRLRINDANEVQVYVLLQSLSDENLQHLAEVGAAVEIKDAVRRRVQARVPVAQLQAVAALPFVDFVRLPNYAVRRIGAVTTEGDAILHSDVVRQQFSLDGTGVRVGVISDGLKGVFATGCTTCSGTAGGPMASGDLPSSTGTRNSRGVLTSSSGGIAGRSFQANQDLEGLPTGACAFPGAGAEGTALLEIVHDIAPGAQLSFANADTDLAFNQAVNFLAGSNDVVVDDLGFLGEAYDGTSRVSSNTANALNNSSNPIRTYVTSVGNDADEHYLGTYTDSGIDGTSITGVSNSGHLHLFQQAGDTTDVLGLGPKPYNVISLPTNGEVVIFLTWDDRFGGSGNNYDLYLVRQSNGTVVARSTDVQSGSQDPVEFIDFVNSGATDFFQIVAQNVRNQAQPKQLNLFSFAPECAATGPRTLAPGHHDRHNYNTLTRSVGAQSDAGGSPVSVISVGAICSASAAAAGTATTDESCRDTTHSTIEFFSSQGPTIDGRMKPDVSAIDGVAITWAGSFENPFFGTSAAAPHVAGIAALLLQSAPCLLNGGTNAHDPASARGSLRDLIVSNAASPTGSPPDNVFGHGRVDSLASVQKALPVYGGTGSLTVSGNTQAGASLTASQLGFSDPNQCQLSRLFWSGACGTPPDSTIHCPFGTTHVSVSASNNGVAFSPAVDLQVTVTNFSVSASPTSATVTAGQSATYQITLAAQGGAFTNNVTLGCSNPPTGASCNFNPPVVMPGSGSVQTSLTITTTARSSGGAMFQPSPEPPLAGLTIVVTIGALAGITMRRRSRTALAFLTAIAIASIVLYPACGGNSSTPPSNSQPPSSSSLNVSPGSLVFTAQSVQTASAPQAVIVTNSGSASVTIGGITTSGDFAQANTCGTSLGAGSTCSISVTFTPTSAGSRAGTLTISSNAANSPQTIGLMGTGQSSAGPTSAGTYQVSITGVSGTLGQSSSVTLVVQ